MGKSNLQIKPTRNSNLEILRIIAMLLIVAFHATRAGYNSHEANLIVYSSGQILGSWGLLGVDLFLVMSAWFLVDQKFRIKKVISIIFQILTWEIAFAGLTILYDILKDNGLKQAIYNFCKTTMSHGIVLWAKDYWFVTSYIFMLIISPLLNKLLSDLTQKQLTKVLLITAFIPIYAQIGAGVVGDIIYFVYAYVLIGYIKKYGSTILTKFAKPLYFMSLMVMVVVARLISYFTDNEFFNANKILRMIKAAINIVLDNTFANVGRHSIIMLVISLLIFFWIIKIKPHYNKYVNIIAGCTLGVYLFHENPNLSLVDGIFSKLTQWGYIGTEFLFPLQYLATVLLIFVLGTVIEYLRQIIIQKPILKLIDQKYVNQYNKIDDWFNGV